MSRVCLKTPQGLSDQGYDEETCVFKIRYCNYILIATIIILASYRLCLIVWDPQRNSKQLPLRNASHLTQAPGLVPAENRGKIAAFRFTPHLLDIMASSRPAYLRSQGRTGVSIVLGVPTVQRRKQSYLRSTLYNLIENMNAEEQNETLIIVYIGEMDGSVIERIVHQIELSFRGHIASGLIDIIAPAPDYYTDFEEHVSWHSKQNLDIAYLMAYAHSKGIYYVQLEDDVLTQRDFLTTMRKFALIKLALANPLEPCWFVLDFSPSSLVGKLFKGAELPYLITFIQLFNKDISMLKMLLHFIQHTLCHNDSVHCQRDMTKYWPHFDVPLFQHIGSLTFKEKLRMLEHKQADNRN
ncbi:alpha-1,3-mannosyl-glycoprotein 4-beta-N-acetylglucosaminyltransferase B-like isoform X2 [Drosophila novamexicana]|uniref:alpha-1,3-mannosyl-glycoprotein 4-beta-N-acetylglucosaminyltransferase B-like isoform X2 n=1 Tax=Drosophila novamexicana TaxID=47314 RepID=UPI0011E59003|nr:alpha-1,3-mannosyl-glycoprotein 4-beta-N-acetylglucosaminyltransferase B-like isoform X2 [Drosophila novamexicana]